VGVINALNLIDGLMAWPRGVAFFAWQPPLLSRPYARTPDDAVMAPWAAHRGFLATIQPGLDLHGGHGIHVLAMSWLWGPCGQPEGVRRVAILVPIVAWALPIADTLLAMLRRTLVGRPMFSAIASTSTTALIGPGLEPAKGRDYPVRGAVLLGAMAVILDAVK